MSTVKAEAWLNLDGTENFKCRAWVNFNGTGTVAIRASGNVSSITDNGIGDYTVAFIDDMPDDNYALSINSNNYHTLAASGRSVSSVNVYAGNTSHVLVDSGLMEVAVHR